MHSRQWRPIVISPIATAALTLAALCIAVAVFSGGCSSTIKKVPAQPPTTVPGVSAQPAATPQPAATAEPVSASQPVAAAEPSGSLQPGAIKPDPALKPLAPSPAPGQNVNRVMASVDGEPITVHDVETFAAANGHPLKVDNPSDTEITKATLKALIGQKLLEQQVKKYDDKVDEGQIDHYIEDLRREQNLTDEQFRAQLLASGISYQDFRKQARLQLEKMMMMQQEVRDKVEIPPEELKAYYDSHQSEFTIEKERLKLAQILIAVAPNATPQEASVLQKKAEGIGSRAMKGEDFDVLARKYSDDESKSHGGELGWFAPGDVMDQILAAVKNLNPGQVSDVIRTQHGFHIIRLEEHQVPGVRPFADVKAEIRDKMANERAKDKLENWVDTDLVKQHYVETMY
ncbi:MAG TPA: peptidylprolyl isomerase [Candidatus Binataceae bacterium]